EGQLRQVLLNLLRNGVEAQPDGGTIRVAAAAVEDGVEFCVEDRGEGVPADQRETIFDPFVTTRERGTGLGLAITRQIVEAHAGTIRCETAPGAGALFRVRLPLRVDGKSP
ncbi:MAG: ATP-binding protein, partial [Myxococcota bacterium]|nr:ATP-binding protein [Myxococcota bacterium]